MLTSLVLTINSLEDFERLPRVYRPVAMAMVLGAAIALLTAFWRPAPWKLVLALAAIPSAVWFFTVDRFLRHGRVENPLQNS